MQQLQEEFHSSGHNYREDSPHLKHWRLYDTLVERLRMVLTITADSGIVPHLLDVGAGEGSFVEPALSSGYCVTALEMSRHSIFTMKERFGTNPNFVVDFDEDGSLGPLGESRYGVILYSAVLHHIPDYVKAIDNAISVHLTQGGSFVSFQDPLLYSSITGTTRHVTQVGYYWWRIMQGNFGRGLQTRIRRLRGVYDDTNPADMSEFHVVRNGVDQNKIVEMLSDRFEDVSLIEYWSSQSGLWQRIGERMGLKNTFAIVAYGFHG